MTTEIKMKRAVWWWRFASILLPGTYAWSFFALDLPWQMVFPPFTFFFLGLGKGYLNLGLRELEIAERIGGKS